MLHDDELKNAGLSKMGALKQQRKQQNRASNVENDEKMVELDDDHKDEDLRGQKQLNKIMSNCCQRSDTDTVFFCHRKCNTRVDQKASECQPCIDMKFLFDVFEYLLEDDHVFHQGFVTKWNKAINRKNLKKTTNKYRKKLC